MLALVSLTKGLGGKERPDAAVTRLMRILVFPSQPSSYLMIGWNGKRISPPSTIAFALLFPFQPTINLRKGVLY